MDLKVLWPLFKLWTLGNSGRCYLGRVCTLDNSTKWPKFVVDVFGVDVLSWKHILVYLFVSFRHCRPFGQPIFQQTCVFAHMFTIRMIFFTILVPPLTPIFFTVPYETSYGLNHMCGSQVLLFEITSILINLNFYIISKNCLKSH